MCLRCEGWSGPTRAERRRTARRRRGPRDAGRVARDGRCTPVPASRYSTSDPATATFRLAPRPTIGISTTSSSSGHTSSGTPWCSWPSSTTVRWRAGARRVSGVASSASSTASDVRAPVAPPRDPPSASTGRSSARAAGAPACRRGPGRRGSAACVAPPCRRRRHRRCAATCPGWRRRRPTGARRSGGPSSRAGVAAAGRADHGASTWRPRSSGPGADPPQCAHVRRAWRRRQAIVVRLPADVRPQSGAPYQGCRGRRPGRTRPTRCHG